MRLPAGEWLELETIDSTQSFLERAIKAGGEVPAAVRAEHQSAGRGRLGRTWIDAPSDSLILSIAMAAYRNHPRPWLLGMALACAAAGVLHCRVRWPNDLYLEGRKLGGILTEVFDGIPVLGLGVNLNQRSFPEEIADRAISLAMHRPPDYDPEKIGRMIWARFSGLPEVADWPDLAPIWLLYDDTPGKRFRTPEGDEAVAMGIGPHGELLGSVNGESRIVLAAEATL